MTAPQPRIDWSVKASGAGIGYGQCKEVGTLSLRFPVGLGIEHQVNFEVNL